MRRDTSRAALADLRKSLDVPVLVDVNLRDPWWTPEGVRWAMAGADCVKMSEGELALLSGHHPDSRDAWVAAASAFRREHEIPSLVVTFGPEGVLFHGEDDAVIWQEASRLDDVVDTVGAGDGFSAVVAMGLFREWPWETILGRAVAFAADICTLRGASPDRPGLYAHHLGRWRDDQ
jgi:fructokinase